MTVLKKQMKEPRSAFRAPEARTDDDCIHVIQSGTNRPQSFIGITLRLHWMFSVRGLWKLDGGDALHGIGCTENHQPST